MNFNTPNLLTLFRILLVPIMVAAYYLPFRGANLIAAALFTAAALTDWLDGYWARRYGQESAFGAFLDPVADKIAVTVALFLIVQTDGTPLMAVVAAVIVGREITISALREWMAEIGQRKRVVVAGLGKFKTILQMVAIIILLLQHRFVGRPLYQVGKALLIVAAVLTIWSAIVYLREAWPAMRPAKPVEPSEKPQVLAAHEPRPGG